MVIFLIFLLLFKFLLTLFSKFLRGAEHSSDILTIEAEVLTVAPAAVAATAAAAAAVEAVLAALAAPAASVASAAVLAAAAAVAAAAAAVAAAAAAAASALVSALVAPVPVIASSPAVSSSSSSRLTRKILPLPFPQGSISSAETFSKNPNPGLTISNPIIEEDIGLIIELADAP